MIHDITYIRQMNQNTCWLACLLMLIEYQRRSRSLKSEFAEYLYRTVISNWRGGVNRSITIRDPNLNRARTALELRPLEARLGMRARTLPRPSSIDTREIIMRSVLDMNPFSLGCYALRGAVRIGHFIVIAGYDRINQDDYFHCVDPGGSRNPRSNLTYQEFLRLYEPMPGTDLLSFK